MRISVKTNSGTWMNFQVKETSVTLGRSNKCTVMIPDESLSRTHCIIENQDGNFFITDPGSSNGVYIDGSRIDVNVRTSFKGFNQLHLGPLECTVEDTDSESDTNPSMNIQLTQSSPSSEKTSVTKMMKREFPGKENIKRSEKPAPAKKSSIKPGVVVPIIIVAAVGYYFMTSNNSDESFEDSDGLTVESKNPAPAYKKNLADNRKAPNEFKLPSEYESFNQSRSCKEYAEFCANLLLDENKFEGIYKSNDEYFVYLNASSRMSDIKYVSGKDLKDISDLIAMDLILGSDILNKYFMREIGQIHLVLNDNNGKPQKVYRFHPAKFIPGTAPRMELITAISDSLRNNNTDEFWRLLGDSVPQISITQ